MYTARPARAPLPAKIPAPRVASGGTLIPTCLSCCLGCINTNGEPAALQMIRRDYEGDRGGWGIDYAPGQIESRPMAGAKEAARPVCPESRIAWVKPGLRQTAEVCAYADHDE